MSEKVRIIYEVTGRHAPVITYHAAMVNNNSEHEQTRLFLQFLSGEQAAEIFQRYGFIRPQDNES
jgi:ABC-type molybdate transport system substrate-binding protein